MSDEPDEFKRDTVEDGDRLLAAVEAELLSDAAEESTSEETHRRVVAEVEDRTGVPARMAHKADVDPPFEVGVYRQGGTDSFPGLLLTTSVDPDGFESDEEAVEELQQRRDTLCRVCEEMEFAPHILDGDELADLITNYRDHDGNDDLE